MEKYKILKTIGDGTYGSVVKAMDKETGEVVAIKKMKKKFYRWDSCISLREVKSLMKLSHPNIVNLYSVSLSGSGKDKNVLYFVFEYLDLNIYQVMKDRKKLFSEPTIRNIIFQTLQGLAYMHKNNYFHRDLKPENLLLYHETLKIADFGLAREINSSPPFTDYVSTRWYRAPEILLWSTDYGPPIDIFAVGAIMAELYTMRPLFPGTSETDQFYKLCQIMGTPTKLQWKKGFDLAQKIGFKFPQWMPQKLSGIIQNASDPALELIASMLHYDPEKRPTASECLQHEYFKISIPIPLNAAAVDDNDSDEDIEEFKQTFTIQQTAENFTKQMKSEIRSKADDLKSVKISSLSLMKKARYRPGVNTKKFYDKK